MLGDVGCVCAFYIDAGEEVGWVVGELGQEGEEGGCGDGGVAEEVEGGAFEAVGADGEVVGDPGLGG